MISEMMRIVPALAVLFAPAVLYAEQFTVGRTALEVPAPEGFVMVTPEMEAMHRFGAQLGAADAVNDFLAYYLPEKQAGEARAGSMIKLDRYFSLQTNARTTSMTWTERDFIQLKDQLKNQNREIVKSVEEKMPEVLARMNRQAGGVPDAKIEMSGLEFLPLEPHYDGEHAIAYSMYIGVGLKQAAEETRQTIAATLSTVVAGGKLLYLYCYGPKDELDWTRSACRSWTDSVLSANADVPGASENETGGIGGRILAGALKGALIGALVGLVVALLRKRTSGTRGERTEIKK